MTRLAGPVDVSTDESLRDALRGVVEAGWDSGLAHAVGNEIVSEASRRVGGLAARRRGVDFAEARADLASRSWEAARTHTDRICAAQANAWGLVVTIASREAAKDDAAARVAGMAVPHSARRAAETVAVDLHDFTTFRQLEVAARPLDGVVTKAPAAVTVDELGPLLSGVSDLLAHHGLGRACARRAVARAGELAVRTRASYRHGAARRDAETGGTLHSLGFNPERASALMNLLVGTRRGGPQSSVLLQAATRGGIDKAALTWQQMSWLFCAATPSEIPPGFQMPLPFAA
jgi:hypothetical protein